VSRLRILYILSLVVLGALLVNAVLRPMATGGKYSEVQREGLLETDVGWVLQFDISNYEGEDKDYTVNVSVDGQLSTVTTSIKNGGTFTYIRDIHEDMLDCRRCQVYIAVKKQGEEIPFEEATYYLK
jgi:hypothetical protein